MIEFDILKVAKGAKVVTRNFLRVTFYENLETISSVKTFFCSIEGDSLNTYIYSNDGKSLDGDPNKDLFLIEELEWNAMHSIHDVLVRKISYEDSKNIEWAKKTLRTKSNAKALLIALQHYRILKQYIKELKEEKKALEEENILLKNAAHNILSGLGTLGSLLSSNTQNKE